MSDALTYLVKARPDAMGHYLAFVKDAGKRLDPKTRNLISVITKVHAQTERGLRQYLKRALREGCTPAEVIDALLMAFPALGLSKIIWAVDVILAMGLPGFELDAITAGLEPPTGDTRADAASLAAESKTAEARAPATWRDLLGADELAPGQTRRIECDGRAVFAHRGDTRWAVYDSLCPHQGTNIPHLALHGTTLSCPKHDWEFDLASGECIARGDQPLRRFECQLRDGRLMARW